MLQNFGDFIKYRDIAMSFCIQNDAIIWGLCHDISPNNHIVYAFVRHRWKIWVFSNRKPRFFMQE